MKRLRFSLLFAALLALLAVGHGAAAPQQQTNLLTNPGFEQPYENGLAQGWTSWHQESERDAECLSGYHFRPRWNIETTGANVAGGTASQYIGNNWDTWSGGVYQTVDVTPGTTYRFTFAAKGRGSNDPSPEPSEGGLNMNIRAGIDPNGSGQWFDGDVVWGAAGSPHDQWQQFSVEATATGNQMTVFTYADWGVEGVNQCRQFLDTWYDNAQLVEVGPPPTNTLPPPPPATAAPANTPTPEATATAEATATPENTATPEPSPTPEGGTICVNAFNDENANGQHDAAEGYIAGVTFTVADETQIVGQAVSNGTETPECFTGLPAGTYQVAQEIPGRLEMTTAANVTLQVETGTTVGVEFGSRIRAVDSDVVEAADATAVAAAQENQDANPGETAETPADTGFSLGEISGLIVIVVGVVLLGVLLFYLLRR